MKLDPLLDVAKRASIEDALARLDEYKAADMDVAFAKFGVKVRAVCGSSALACACRAVPLLTHLFCGGATVA
jgi:hypothetical protein